MTQRKPWEPEDYRPNVPFSQLPESQQAAMKARLAITLAELRSAVPTNELLRRPSTPVGRVSAQLPQEQSA